MTKFQNYKHYKLPITMNPLEYGKLLVQIADTYVVQFNRTNISIIKENIEHNDIKFFKEGDLIYNYKDFKINETTFVRSLENKKFTFKNNKIILVDIQNLAIVLITLFLIFYNITNLLDSSILLSSSIIKLRKVSPKNYRSNWNSIFFKIDEQIFSIKLIEYYFNKFWKIVSPKILEGCHIFILLKFQYSDNNFHTIGKLIRIDKNNYSTFIEQIESYIEIMGEYYKLKSINKIIFSYGFKKGEITEKIFSTSEIKLMEFKDMKFPISINPRDFGKIINTSSSSEKKNIYNFR